MKPFATTLPAVILIFFLALLPAAEAGAPWMAQPSGFPPAGIDIRSLPAPIPPNFSAPGGITSTETAATRLYSSRMSTDLRQLTGISPIPPGQDPARLVGDMYANGLVRQPVTSATAFMTNGATEPEVKVQITLREGGTPLDIIPYVQELIGYDRQGRTAAAWVRVSDTRDLALSRSVQSVRIAYPPVLNTGPIMNTGSVNTEGDAIHFARYVRDTFGINGTGVKVGVISDGVDTMATAQASGDLPSDVQVLSNIVHGDEGTAMLEIIHDLAPGAKLYFHDCGGTTVEFNQAVDALVAANCTIIVDDVGWTTEPFYHDGPVAAHINDTVSTFTTLMYISSAGNSGHPRDPSGSLYTPNGHYQGNYYPSEGNNHDFSEGGGLRPLVVVMFPGSTIQAVLEWDDPWESSSNDYNLILTNSTGDIKAVSNNAQTGSSHPLEVIWYTNSGIIDTLSLWVNNNNGIASPRNLEVYTYCRSGSEFVNTFNLVPADSIFGQPAAKGVIATGANPASSPDSLESFSSKGPVTIIAPVPESRTKPDVTGVDGVSITGAGGFPSPFYGTSASAPHVAGIAALVWSGNLTRTRDEVQEALFTSADHLGSAGKNTEFGFGRVNASAMHTRLFPEETPVTPTPTPTPTPSPNATPNATPTATPTPTPSPNATPNATPTVTPTPTPSPNATPNATPTVTPSPIPTATPSVTPTATPTPTPTRFIPAGPPVAGFITGGPAGNASILTGTVPLTVRFYSDSTGDVTHIWDFGDNHYSIENNPEHLYEYSGTYTVRLTCQNPLGITTAERMYCIVVNQSGISP